MIEPIKTQKDPQTQKVSVTIIKLNILCITSKQ